MRTPKAGDLAVDGGSPPTRLQMLRSGRGDGYRAALNALALDDVIACVVDDPRWDRQVEDRDEYYAALLVRMNADVQPMVDRILDSSDQADESTCWLPVGVLAQMARRGHFAAALGLARCVRQGQFDRCWTELADQLRKIPSPEQVARKASAEELAYEAVLIGRQIDRRLGRLESIVPPELMKEPDHQLWRQEYHRIIASIAVRKGLTVSAADARPKARKTAPQKKAKRSIKWRG